MDLPALENEILEIAEDSLDLYMDTLPDQYDSGDISVNIMDDPTSLNINVIIELSIRINIDIHSARASFSFTSRQIDNNILEPTVSRSVRRGVEAIAEKGSETITVCNGDVKIFDREGSVTAKCKFCNSESTVDKTYFNITVGMPSEDDIFGVPDDTKETCKNITILKHYAIGKLLHEKCDHGCPLRREFCQKINRNI